MVGIVTREVLVILLEEEVLAIHMSSLHLEVAGFPHPI
jgi:hypothetical protein